MSPSRRSPSNRTGKPGARQRQQSPVGARRRRDESRDAGDERKEFGREAKGPRSRTAREGAFERGADRPRKFRDRAATGDDSDRERRARPDSDRTAGPGERARESYGPAPAAPRKGRPQVRRPQHPVSATAVRVQWQGFRPLYDFWGKEIKRFYQLETLANATERMLERGGDKFIVPSVQRALGPSRVTSLVFELFQEGKYQLIFRVRASNERHKQAVFGFVAAKKEGEFSKLAGIEHANLCALHLRAPNAIVTPYLGGTIYLPDRLRREGKGREIYAYLTQWLGAYHELGVSKNHQFYINIQNPQNLSIAQTEELKGQMVEIIARTYDPVKRTCMEMPQIASGDFVVTKPTQGDLKLKLIACRNLARNVTPGKLIDLIAGARWDWAGRTFRLAPDHPETLLEGLKRAVGLEIARAWLTQYRVGVEEKRFPERRPLVLERLDALGIVIR